MKRALLAFALIALAYACAPTATETPTTPSTATGTQSVAAAACTARGGVMQRVGRMQSMRCVVRYADAGKACHDKADCTGRCLGPPGATPGSAATGACENDDSGFVCNSFIERGHATASICVD